MVEARHSRKTLMGLTQVNHFSLTIDSRPDLRLHDDCPYPMSPFAVIQARDVEIVPQSPGACRHQEVGAGLDVAAPAAHEQVKANDSAGISGFERDTLSLRIGQVQQAGQEFSDDGFFNASL